MAVKGFDIKLGADTSAFLRALREMDKPIKDAQKQIQRLNEGLKLDPTNVTILTSKQQQLANRITDTKDRLKYLNQEEQKYQDLLAKNGSLTTEQQRLFQRIQGEIAVTEQELKNLQDEYNKFGSVGLQQVHAVGEKMGELSSKIEMVGQKLMKISMATGAVLTGAVKASINWEDAWVGVTKTVNGTDEQMQKLEDDLLNMAKATGVSKSELAKFAETAGQSGIAVDDIAEFTKIISDLNVATNITGEEGARSIARLFNQMQIGTNEVSNFGSALTALGNNFPTTEREILDLSSRLASTGEIVGLSGQEVLALATAMSSLGAEAEAGGTAMSKIFRKMQLAIAKGGDQLEQFAEVSGMSVDEFVASFGSDALGTLQDFIHGLADMQNSGGDVVKTLDDMKLSEVRLSDQLLRLVGNEDLLTKALEISNQSWQDNYALAEEADKRYGTLTYRMGALKEQVDTIAVKLGNVLLPILKKIIDRVQEWLEKFENLSPQTQEMIVKILLATTALAPLLVIIGKVGGAIGTILKMLPSMNTMLSVASKAFTALTSPIGIVVMAIGALIAVFAHLYQTNEEFRDKANETWGHIVEFFQNSVLPLIQTIGDVVGTVANTIWSIIQEIWSLIEPFIQEIFEILMDWWNESGQEIFDLLSKVLGFLFEAVGWIWKNVIEPLIKFFVEMLMPKISFALGVIQGIFEAVFGAISAMWNGFKETLQGVITFIEGVFSGDWSKAWEGVKQIFKGIMDGISGIGKGVINGIIDAINGFIRGANNIKIPDFVPRNRWSRYQHTFNT
jgi:TP901 family phage tail tape measure protein